MAIEIFETALSRSTKTGKGASARVMYFVRGTNNEREVRLLVLATAPRKYEVLVRQSTQQDPLGNGCWTCSVDYDLGEMQNDKNPNDKNANDDQKPSPHDPIGPHVNFSILGKTQKITQSLYTVDRAQRVEDLRKLPDHRGAIGVCKGSSGGQEVEGCDINVPALTWTEEWSFNPMFLTWNYIKTLRNMYGRTNGPSPNKADAATINDPAYYNGVFRTHDVGEVKFVGAELQWAGDERGKITFHFEAEVNAVDFRLIDGGGDNPQQFGKVQKRGHEYLWVEYEEDVVDKNPVKIPRAVYVEDVGLPGLERSILISGTPDAGVFKTVPTNQADFRLLGIGR